jgi:ABC-type lipoprotein export system ATPase subunit
VEGNIKLPFIYSRTNGASRKSVEQVLQDVDLPSMGRRYPGELSGGQQQRVAIARALVSGAELILADEPTGNLDADSAQSILNVFRQLVDQGKTVLLVTHDPAVASRASRQIRLQEGLIAADTSASSGVSL